MFPYRLRPPLLGEKYNRKRPRRNDGGVLPRSDNTTTTNTHGQEYAFGGPLQRAIRKDLEAIRQQFLHEHHDAQETTGQVNHCPKGMSFRVFRTVFRRNRVAALHTRVSPPRCDRGAYSQLLYAVCLDMMKDALMESVEKAEDNRADEDRETAPRKQEKAFEMASFAIFCLYALYQTHPLQETKGHDTDKNNEQTPRSTKRRDNAKKLQMLPMGLYMRENPKMTYRRSFCSPIRIDIYCYSLMIRLRDMALTLAAECEVHRRHYIVQEKTRTDPEHDRDRLCVCSLALDLLSIVDRLEPFLEFCAYTGPCSLEGLAGHAEFPFALHASPKTQMYPVNASDGLLSQQQDQTISKPMFDVEEQLCNYKESCNKVFETLAIPKNSSSSERRTLNQMQRVQDVIRPLLASKNIHQRQTLTVKRVAFEPGTIDKSSGTKEFEESSGGGGNEVAVRAADDAEHSLSYEISLPETLSDLQKESFYDSIDCLLRREDRPLEFRTVASEADASTIQSGAFSAATASTGVGRDALASLLRQAQDTQRHTKARKRRTVSSEFLGEPKERRRPQVDVTPGDLSDMSSSDEETVLSGALSTGELGGRALSDLLHLAVSGRSRR